MVFPCTQQVEFGIGADVENRFLAPDSDSDGLPYMAKLSETGDRPPFSKDLIFLLTHHPNRLRLSSIRHDISYRKYIQTIEANIWVGNRERYLVDIGKQFGKK